ncbi:TIGR01212 family radical SAM protein [Desulfovibrio sp. OttesenSCG-928-M16]|nr:TIGR01212 family radical SAM protein [Desulfovibrio sp. OttesenSCG-928-M16]
MIPFSPFMRADETEPPRWNRLSDYFLQQYGARVWKIPLDAGFSCPNRDGRLSHSGCVFCNPAGAGTRLGLGGLGLAEQWRIRCQGPRIRGLTHFIAYLQSFSNTYGPIEKLAKTLNDLADLPGCIGLAVGTRPDCVDEGKLALIAAFCRERQWPEVWVEYGVQSANNATLARINRGHDRDCAERAIATAAAAGLKVCVHLMAALPSEGASDLEASAQWLSKQPVQGVKFHCLYVCKGSDLEAAHACGDYRPWTQKRYIAALAGALPHVRSDIVIQRLAGDPAPGELVAPEWCARSRETTNGLLAELKRQDTWQGKLWPAGLPEPI